MLTLPGNPDLTWLSRGLGGGWARKGLGYLQSRSGEKGRGRGSLSMPLGSWMGGTFMSHSVPSTLRVKERPALKRLVRPAPLCNQRKVSGPAVL